MTTENDAIEFDAEAVTKNIHNLANIYLRVGNHEVKMVIKEVASALCHMVGVQHKVFFPDGPPIRDAAPSGALTIPATPGNRWPQAQMPQQAPMAGINPFPEMGPSPYALPADNGAGAAPAGTSGFGDPGNADGARMVVVDPGPGEEVMKQRLGLAPPPLTAPAIVIPPGYKLVPDANTPVGVQKWPSPYPGLVYLQDVIPSTPLATANPALTPEMMAAAQTGKVVVVPVTEERAP